MTQYNTMMTGGTQGPTMGHQGGFSMDPGTAMMISQGLGIAYDIFGRKKQGGGGGAIRPGSSGITHDNWWQENLIRNSLKWKVDGAKEAGIHPLAAIGAPSASPVASMVGGEGYDSDFGRRMGQDIGRALVAGMNKDQRAMTKLQIESAELDNEAKRLGILQKRKDINDINLKGDPTTTKSVGINAKVTPAQEAGDHSAFTHINIGGGALRPVQSEYAKQATEDDVLQQGAINAQIVAGGQHTKPHRSKWAKGAVDYYYDAKQIAWIPLFKGQKKPTRMSDTLRKMKSKDKYKLYKGSGPLYKKLWNK